MKSGKVKAASTVGPQKALIASEEQFKLFTLPSLKPDRKSKLTAHEGSRARRVIISRFSSKSDDSVMEHNMICLSNQGDVSIYDISSLKRLLQQKSLIRKEDVHGISSALFTSCGEGFYLHSPSEFRRFSISAKRVLIPSGIIEVPEGARPVRVAEAPAPTQDENAARESQEAVAQVSSGPEAVCTIQEGPATAETSAADPPVSEPVAHPVESESVAQVITESDPVVSEPVASSSPVPVSNVPVLSESSPSPVLESLPSTLEEDGPDDEQNNYDSIIDHEIMGIIESSDDRPLVDVPPAVVNHVPAVETNGHNGSSHTHGANGSLNGTNEDLLMTNGNDHIDGSSSGLIHNNSLTDYHALLDNSDLSILTNADITIDSVRDFTA